MLINIPKFIELYKVNNTYVSSTVTGLNNILNNINNDPAINNNINYISYLLATIFWETDKKMYPSSEIRQIKTDTPRRREVKRLQDRYWNSGFYGRGYCHITWKNNYQNMSHILKASGKARYTNENDSFLVLHPEKALEPDIAYDIISLGMLMGAFSGNGKGLAYYLDKTPSDYVNARKTVNGLDQARTIADIAIKFESWLKQAI